MAETIGFIGLGALGAPIAANILELGYSLAVFNRTSSKAEPLVARGARLAKTPADAASPGGIVVTLLWDDASVEEVVGSEGFLDALAGGVHVSMSTISPEGSRRLAARHAVHGSHMVEAPIFGRPDAAAARKLWMSMAGPQAAKERVRPLLDAMGAQGAFDFGEEIGAATTVKLIGNFLISSAARSMNEGLAMADAGGYDMKAIVDMLTTTLFPAPIYQTYGAMIAARRISAGGSPIIEKDLALFEAAATAAGSPTVMVRALIDLMGR